jgi:SAM-dependent methyltransferase
MSTLTPERDAAPVFAKSDYKEYPKTLAADDLWGQVRRTVNGRPVSDEQIAMIVQAIRAGLQLRSDDVLLDLACGNGALSSYLFDDCAAVHGVDYSDYLIQVARERFTLAGRTGFEVDDAAGYVRREPDPMRFTKVLCYGSFMFFPQADAAAVLAGLHRRFARVRRIFIGNLPDKDRAHLFYPPGKDYQAELSDPAAQIGIWRSEREWEALADATGWQLRLSRMPQDFYAARYRFDAILDRVD